MLTILHAPKIEMGDEIVEYWINCHYPILIESSGLKQGYL
jgi:hypothetical protein